MMYIASESLVVVLPNHLWSFEAMPPSHSALGVAVEDSTEDVVISGVSGRLPESDNVEEFRQHLINKEDMVTEDDRRWTPGEESQ